MSSARAATVHTYHNPVFSQDFPDPAVLKVGGSYYAYGTTTGWEPPGHEFPILRSNDLAHWEYVGDALNTPPTWSTGDWWAPDVIAHNGMYFMYYVGLKDGRHCVAVATARTPVGPFVHRHVIGCGDATGDGYIDPAPLVDTDGKAYLYLSVDDPMHSISVIPLAPDLLRSVGPRRQLFSLSQSWEFGASFSTVEGPFAVKRGNIYYLFYSGNDWQHSYAMGYATATSPIGPFRKSGHNPILKGDAGAVGPGGGSLIQGPHGGWWLAYHAWTGGPGYDSGGVRNLRIDRVRWQGSAVTIHGPTEDTEPAP